MVAESSRKLTDRDSAGKRIGLPNAFTCHYPSVQVIAQFLRNCGMDVVKTPRTTPAILRTGTTVCSADFCVPVRAQVGHIYTLAQEHPDLDFILVPNLCYEHAGASNCSKYHDISGIAIRALAGTAAYVARGAAPAAQAKLRAWFGDAAFDAQLCRGAELPPLLCPEIRGSEPDALFLTCYSLCCDICGLPKSWTQLELFTPAGIEPVLAPHRRRCREAFNSAYAAVMQRSSRRWDALLQDETSPRLAIVGRNYLHEDPTLTVDVKRFFRQHGCAVVTPHDVPFELLKDGFERTVGFYETQKLYESFVDLAAPHVDGFIVIGAFGCHPDAFENEYFVEYCRARGLPTWLFKYDAQSGSAGFQTRYETILGFLEQRRDARLHGASAPPADAATGVMPGFHKVGATMAKLTDGVRRRPLIIWPHMSPVVDALVEEAFHQAGLGDIYVRPLPLSEQTLAAGNYKFTESCCPFAFTTGSLIETVERALVDIRQEPRRIMLLQARGLGPCTYGWYAQLQALELPKHFAHTLDEGNHTMEMVTLAVSGVVELVRELAALGDARKLRPVLEYVEAAGQPGGLGTLPLLRRTRLAVNLARAIDPMKGTLTRTVWWKIKALEEVRARALVVRAHERQRGDCTAVWRDCCREMRSAHTAAAIQAVKQTALRGLCSLPQDDEPKPRALVCGEIYVLLASFANRGTVDNLLGAEGIEVVEGLSLSGFIASSLREMRRRRLENTPGVRPFVQFLRRHNFAVLQQVHRGLYAAPFLLHEVGGDGIRSVSEVREHLDHGAVDGVVHLFPFKCMPEMIARTAISEVAQLHGAPYLPLSFDKETDMERLKTEISTFASLLHLGLGERRSPAAATARRRRAVAIRHLNRLWQQQRRRRYCD